VLYAPQHRLGLKVELLMKEKLVLVTTAKGRKEPAAESPAGDYVYVDWGPDFAAQHNLTYPERANPGTYVGLGPLGLQYILKAGGSGYFRAHAVAPYLRSRRLRLVHGAPEFLYPAYAVYSEGADLKIMAPALAGLRHIAKAQDTPLRKRLRR
jgi:LysR family transcriptional regulator, flagellar master operon regulator